jgi:hypothetical protein
MSVENIEKFYAMAFKDQSLIQDLKAATDEANFANIAVGLGAANGCDFTAEEVIEWRKAKILAATNGELDDLQLEAVAGGKISGGGIASIVLGGLLIVGAGVAEVASLGFGTPAVVGMAATGAGLIAKGVSTDPGS